MFPRFGVPEKIWQPCSEGATVDFTEIYFSSANHSPGSLDICGLSFNNCCQIHDMLSGDFPMNFNPGVVDNFTGEYLQG
jgi:hypothetical protein